jgi:uncharacterized protein
MKLTHWIATAFTLLALAMPGEAQVSIEGPWHGTVQTPVGQMTLIITIARGENGALRGEIESPDQGGRKGALTTVTATGGRLAFTSAANQISYEGQWLEAEQHWSGVYRQGGTTPLMLRRGLPPPRPSIVGLDGVWQGVVTRNGVDLRLVLRVATGDRGTGATFDSPDLGVAGLPVAGLSRSGQTVGFAVPASGARFAGTLSEDGTRVTGTWSLPGQPDVIVAFVRAPTTAAYARRARPQTPRPPFTYRAEEVTFNNPDANHVTLAGTLTLPDGMGPFPAAVLITGSGPQDRDETQSGHKPFAVLADHLTRHGIAVLRYDDRGVGRSTGDFAAATSADFATDANTAVRFLLTRPEIARQAVGLIGHSEGGMVAPIAAVANNAVRFLVLLAGPGTDLIRLAHSQQRLLGLSQGRTDDEITRMAPVMTRIFTAVTQSASTEDARARVRAILTPDAMATLKIPEPLTESLVQEKATEWFRYFLTYNPAESLSRIRVPVLALNGSLDLQVPADDNLAAIASALARNPDVTIRKLEGLNHMFQTARTGAIGEFGDIDETMSPAVLALVTEWIERRFTQGRCAAIAGTFFNAC